MGEELKAHLAVPAEGFGEGREDGSSRQVLTQSREELRARVISRALTLHRDQTTRPV